MRWGRITAFSPIPSSGKFTLLRTVLPRRWRPVAISQEWRQMRPIEPVGKQESAVKVGCSDGTSGSHVACDRNRKRCEGNQEHTYSQFHCLLLRGLDWECFAREKIGERAQTRAAQRRLLRKRSTVGGRALSETSDQEWSQGASTTIEWGEKYPGAKPTGGQWQNTQSRLVKS